MTPTSCLFSRSSTSDFLRSTDNRILVNEVNILLYFSVVRDSLTKLALCVIGYPLCHNGEKVMKINEMIARENIILSNFPD